MAKKPLPCFRVRRHLSLAIKECYEAQHKGELTSSKADNLAKSIARVADRSLKLCKRPKK